MKNINIGRRNGEMFTISEYENVHDFFLFFIFQFSTMNMCYFHNHKNICGLNIYFGFDFQRRF